MDIILKSLMTAYKRQIVELYCSGEYSIQQLEYEYQVSSSTLLDWVKQYSSLISSEQEEYRVLKKENKRLLTEKEILVKAFPIIA